MKITIANLHQEVTYYTIPNGTYKARQTGARLEIETPIGMFVGECDLSVRGINIPCTVTVKNGEYELNYISNGKI